MKAWIVTDEYEADIRVKICELEKADIETVNRFAAEIVFPDNKKLLKTAADLTKKYLFFKYGVELKEVTLDATK